MKAKILTLVLYLLVFTSTISQIDAQQNFNDIDQIELISNDYDLGKVVSVKYDGYKKAIMERVFDRTKLNRIIFDSTIYSVEDDLALASLANEPQSETSYNGLELQIEQSLPIFLIDFSISEEQLELIYKDIDEFSDQLITTTTPLFDVNSPMFLLVLPLAGFVLIRIENDKLDFNSLKRVFCFVFVTILISSAVITPLSISSAYWDIAYAEELNDVQPTSEDESTIDSSSPIESESEVVESVDDIFLTNFQSLGDSITTESVESNVTSVEPVNATTVEPVSATSVEPVNATTVEPVNATTVEPVNATTVEPVSATSVEPVNATSAESVNATSVESVNATTVEPVNATTVEPVSATSVEPVNATSVESVNATSVESVNATSVESVNATSVEPVESVESINATSVEPVNATTTEPVNATSVESVNATTIEPVDSNATSVEPVNATTTEPVNATSVESVNATSVESVNATSVEPVEPEPEIIVPEATITLQFNDPQPESIPENGTSTDAQLEETTLELSGDGGFIQIENVTVTNDLNGLTVTAWVKPDYSAGSSEFTVLSKEKSFSLTINNNIQPVQIAKFAVFDGIRWTTVESTSVVEEKWTFLSATFNGETIAIFVNGVRENTEEIVGVPTLSVSGKLETTTVDSITSEEDIVIGATITTKNGISTPSNQFSGEIDDVLLYDYVLEDEQIRAIYEQSKDTYAALDNIVELSIEELVAQIAAELAQKEILVEPVDATAVIQPLVELQVDPVLTSVKETYLISEDAVLELEFYNEYDVLMNELTELDNAMQLLIIDVNQTLQETTIGLDPAANQTSSNPVLNFINILFSIPQAEAANLSDEDASKIEIENAKAEIKKLKAQLDALKEDPNLTEEEIKAAKAQLKTVIDQIKATASQVSKTELKDEGAKLQKEAEDVEMIGGIDPDAPIQADNWVGVDETIVGEVYDSEGKTIPLKVSYEKLRDGKFSIMVEFDNDTKPGLYKLKTTLTVNGQTYVSESEFAWGLVSLNTVKSIYNPGEVADFVIVVLDNQGHPVCDANLSMSITDPNSLIAKLSSENGITANPDCGLYDAEYITSIEGTYLIDINAQTEGINTNFNTTFEVLSFFEFDIIRTAQSKIDPVNDPNSFDVRIDIESFVNENSLVIKETVPAVFDVVTDGAVQIVGDTKVLTWNKQLIEDKTYVEYSYSIPLEFPQLYALGPIEINYGNAQTFTEARPWFVAADPQSATPDGDVDTTGWAEGVPGADADSFLFNEIDEVTADGDTTYVTTTTQGADFEVSLSDVADPNSNTGHIIHVTVELIGGGGGPERITLALFEGATQRAVSGNLAVNRNSYTELTYTLTAAEADSITDYANLNIRITAVVLGNGEEIRVTQAFLEVGDADVTPPTLDSAQTKTTTTIDVTFSEDIDGTTIEAADFTVEGHTISTASETSAGIVTITLSTTMGAAETPLVTLVGSVSDNAGNAQTSGSATPSDGIVPTVSSAATASTTSIDLTMSESVVDNSAIPGDFTVSGVASNPLVTSISVSGSTVTLNLDNSMLSSETITVSYTKTTGSIDDTVGNKLKNFAGQSVTNNIGGLSKSLSESITVVDSVATTATLFKSLTESIATADAVTGVHIPNGIVNNPVALAESVAVTDAVVDTFTVSTDDAPTLVSAALTASKTITLVYSESVTTAKGDYSNLVLTAGGARNIITLSGSGTAIILLTFSGASAATDETATIDIAATVIDLANKPLTAITGQAVADGVGPTIVSSKVTGANEITVVYSENTTSATTDYTAITVGGVDRSITTVAGTGTDTHVLTFDGGPAGVNDTGTMTVGVGVVDTAASNVLQGAPIVEVLADGQADVVSIKVTAADKITIVYTDAVDSATTDYSDITVDGVSGRSIKKVNGTGTDTHVLTFFSPAAATNATGTITIGALNDEGSGFTFAGVAAAAIADGVGPTIVSSKVTGANEITVVYSENTTSATTDYTAITVGGVDRSITTVAGTGTDTHVLTFDGAAAATNATGTMTVGVGVVDTAASNVLQGAPIVEVLADGQIDVQVGEDEELIDKFQTTVTMNQAQPRLVVVDSDIELAFIIIPATVLGPSISFSGIQDFSGEVIFGPELIITAFNTVIETTVSIPLGTQIVGTSIGWLGELFLPTPVSLSISEVDVDLSIKFGGDVPLTFSKPIKITFAGQNGKLAFITESGGEPEQITVAVFPECDPAYPHPNVEKVERKALIQALKEELKKLSPKACVVDPETTGADLVILTLTASTFSTGRPSPSAPSGGGGVSGGGNTGTGPGSPGASGFGVILFSPLKIHEISYDICTENMVAILVANDDAVIPTVTLQTTKSGTIEAVLATEQPFEERNKFTTVDKYLFVAPLDPKESFFMVQVKAASGTKVNTINGAVHITECQGIILFDEIPEEFEGIEFLKPRIFDVKIQIDNGTLQSAISPETTYLDDQELTISAIVNSQVPLKRAELRYVIAGQSDDYITFQMDINPLEGVYTAAKISASIPSMFMVAPGIEYWIHVFDENLDEVTSQHYTMGVKPDYDVDASIELDIPTSKPEGSTIRPSAYVINHSEEPAFGTVSLLVDGKVVSSATEFFGAGETKVTLEWVIPKERQYMVYAIQAKLDLYDTSATTEKAYVSSFMKTRIISISEMQTIQPVIDQAGNTVAQPALLYASDSKHDNMRFRVIGDGGFCFIGATDECAVKESTFNKRGGIESIEHNGIIYRVKYSGVDSPLERFSITSVDKISTDWNITLESVDDFIPQAFAMEDIHLKVKYRTISDLVTVSSD